MILVKKSSVLLIVGIILAGPLSAKEFPAIDKLKEHITQRGAMNDPTQLNTEEFLKRCDLTLGFLNLPITQSSDKMKETQKSHEDVLVRLALPKLRELAEAFLPPTQKANVKKLIAEVSKLTPKQAKPELPTLKDFIFKIEPGRSIANNPNEKYENRI